MPNVLALYTREERRSLCLTINLEVILVLIYEQGSACPHRHNQTFTTRVSRVKKGKYIRER